MHSTAIFSYSSKNLHCSVNLEPAVERRRRLARGRVQKYRSRKRWQKVNSTEDTKGIHVVKIESVCWSNHFSHLYILTHFSLIYRFTFNWQSDSYPAIFHFLFNFHSPPTPDHHNNVISMSGTISHLATLIMFLSYLVQYIFTEFGPFYLNIITYPRYIYTHTYSQ